jgi:predicted TIM-barrel fold metal-dependent hydrolase
MKSDRGLDIDREHPNMPPARAMADRHADLTIVLEHVGFPRPRDDECFRAWRQGLADLERAEHVVCKISGVAMTDPLFTKESLAPWVQCCLAKFGPE